MTPLFSASCWPGLVLLLFLRNIKITLIALVAVPSVLAATVLILYVFNLSFNIMTLRRNGRGRGAHHR